MDDRLFLDTNVVVYAYDRHEPDKSLKARSILKSGILQDNVVVSSQVLGEFFVVVTQRIKEPMSADEAMKIIAVLSVLTVAEIDLSLVMSAIEIHKTHGIHYWDSLIVAAAERTGCSALLSEDLHDGQQYGTVVVKNPFL